MQLPLSVVTGNEFVAWAKEAYKKPFEPAEAAQVPEAALPDSAINIVDSTSMAQAATAGH